MGCLLFEDLFVPQLDLYKLHNKDVKLQLKILTCNRNAKFACGT